MEVDDELTGSEPPSSLSPERNAQTLFALQRLEQGQLQRLGDELLPWKYPELLGLKSNGLSNEGKTRKGVPDSFVGATAGDCRAAVEYTTQASNLVDKLASDYASVRKKCPRATSVFLCTNRPVESSLVVKLEEQALADGVHLTVIDGMQLAECLATQRQDLRERFLAIPVGTHTRDSLVASMALRLQERIPTTVRKALARRVLARPAANRALHNLMTRRGSTIVLATAVAGTGKSVWSAYQAEARAETQPVTWAPANMLHWEQRDPVGLHIVQEAFGVPDPARAHQLVDLLRREHLPVLVVLDGIDEADDFAALTRALQDFRASAFAPSTTLLLTCREEALVQLASAIESWRPELLNARDGTCVRIEPLSTQERRAFLTTEGATSDEVRRLESSIPTHLDSIPLFLKQSLAILREGGEPRTDNIIDSFAKLAIRDITKRMRRNGRGPSEARITDFLRDFAVRTICTPTDSLDYALVEQLGDGIAEGEGEGSLIGRSIQAGLLEERGERQLGFAHALYLEYFAAKAAVNAWPPSFPEVGSDRGKQIARRLVLFMPDPSWLIEAILATDATTACLCASQATVLSSELSERLAHALTPLFESRFASDRIRAFSLLGELRSPTARKSAIQWWNGADVPRRNGLARTAARVFLQLEVPEAFEIIVTHHWFRSDIAWYEPSFIANIRQSSAEFRDAMAKRAHEALDSGDLTWKRRATLITVLAMFGDTAFVEKLFDVVERGGQLSTAELRALLHANTPRAMEVYAHAVDNAIAVPIEAELGEDDKEREAQRYNRLESLVPRTADVRMHPCDAAVELAEAALSSTNDDHVSFGVDLADLLAAPVLLPAYMTARRHWRGFGASRLGFIRRLVQERSFSEMRSLFDTHPDPEIRDAIVACAHEVPGAETEKFLLELLDGAEYRTSAVASLGRLRARRAGPAILRLYETTSDRRDRRTYIQALGDVGYRPAAPALSSQLLQCQRSPVRIH